MISRHSLQAALLATLSLAACQDEKPPTPAVDQEVALIVDGISVSRGELEEHLPYFRSTSNLGRNYILREILTQHLLPLKFAQRDFAAARKEQRQRAEALVKILGQGSYADLLRLSEHYPNRKLLQAEGRQGKFAIPETCWVFDDMNVGGVSPILELPQGFSILGAIAKHPGRTTAYDTVDACVLHFFNLDTEEYAAWRKEAKKSFQGKLSYVHPDYVDALPPGLQP